VILHTVAISIISAALLAIPFTLFLGDAFPDRPRGVGNLSFRFTMLLLLLTGWLLVLAFRRVGALPSLPIFLLAGLLVGSVADLVLAAGYPAPNGVDPVRRLSLAGGCGTFAVAGAWVYLLKYDDGSSEPRWFRRG